MLAIQRMIKTSPNLRKMIFRGYLSSAEKIPADSEVARMAREKKLKELKESDKGGIH